jgi:TonB family protein
MRRWLKCSLFLFCAVAAVSTGAERGWAQQESTPKPVSVGAQAVAVVLKHYAVNPLALEPTTQKPLSREGSWSISKTAPASCPQTSGACVEAMYKVPAEAVQCSWVVLLNGDGKDGKFLEENDDTERYFMRVASMSEASALLNATKDPTYPPIAMAARVTGDVVIEAVIGKSGKVQNAFVVSGPAMLLQASLDAARNWSFKPVMLGARAVPYEVKLVFKFQMTGATIAKGELAP